MKLKKAFTVIEMMIVVLIIWIWLIWVISTISSSYRFLYNTKNKVTAINIARAWMEEVFNIRNTNWTRWWGKKDQCWLKVNPLYANTDNKCEKDTWFGSGSYVLVSTWIEQKYFMLTKKTTPLNITWTITSNDWKYLVCKNNDWLLVNCWSSTTKRPANYFDSTLFFQQIRWGYLNDKQHSNWDGNNIDCDDGTTTLSPWTCGDGRALEKNFCVDVVYFDGNKKNVTFCSVLTNFKK